MGGSSVNKKNILTLALLFICWVVGFIDKSAINIAIIPISKELSLSSSQSGVIISGFFLAYSLTQLVGGYLVDRLGSRRILTGAVGLWSIATACTAATAETHPPERSYFFAHCPSDSNDCSSSGSHLA